MGEVADAPELYRRSGWGEGEAIIWVPSQREGKISEGIFKYANGRERETKDINGRGFERQNG